LIVLIDKNLIVEHMVMNNMAVWQQLTKTFTQIFLNILADYSNIGAKMIKPQTRSTGRKEEKV